MHKNPYVQVALTYVRRPFATSRSRLNSAMGVIFLLGGTVWFRLASAHQSRDTWFDTPALYLALGLMWWCIGLLIHIREQFVDSRAHIMPNFRRIHGIVAAIATSLVVVLLPAALTWAAGLRSVGLVAVAVLMIGAFLFTAALPAGRPRLLLGLALGAGWLGLLAGGLRGLASGQYEFLAFALLFIGAAMTLVGGIRLIRLTEDMPEYNPTIRGDRTAEAQMIGQCEGREGTAWKWLFVHTLDRRIERRIKHARRAATSRWSEIARWGVGTIADWYFWLFVAGVLLCFQITCWMITPRNGLPLPIPTFVIFLPCLIMPALLSMVARVWWVGILPCELMLPVQRSACLRQVGSATALNLFQWWFGMAVATISWLVVAAPMPVPFSEIAGCIAVSATCQVWVFGVTACFARIREAPAGLMGAPMIVFGALGLTAQLVSWPWTPWVIAGTFTLLGFLLTYAAYRRWLVADFDW
jgi:hypothetical protein